MGEPWLVVPPRVPQHANLPQAREATAGLGAKRPPLPFPGSPTLASGRFLVRFSLCRAGHRRTGSDNSLGHHYRHGLSLRWRLLIVSKERRQECRQGMWPKRGHQSCPVGFGDVPAAWITTARLPKSPRIGLQYLKDILLWAAIKANAEAPCPSLGGATKNVHVGITSACRLAASCSHSSTVQQIIFHIFHSPPGHSSAKLEGLPWHQVQSVQSVPLTW